MSWDVNNEKLLCLVVLDDDLALKVFPDAASGFFRAFIVQDRHTGEVTTKYRFNWTGRGKSWWQMKHMEWNRENGLAKLKTVLTLMVTMTAANLHDVVIPDDAIHFFEPPDDCGDASKTIGWLLEKDLITMTRVDAPGEDYIN